MKKVIFINSDRIKITYTLFTIVLYLLLFTLPLQALEKEEVKIQHINFAEEANWPPFTPNKYGLTTEGLSYNLMKAIFSRLDISIEVELFPQKRVLQYLKSGKKDGATVISKNAERLKYLEYTDSIFQKRGYIYFLADKKPPFDWETYEDLKGFQIGLVSGHNYGNEFKQATEKYKLNIQSTNQIEQNFYKLLNNRIDILLCIEMTANQILRDPKFAGKIINAPKTYYSKGYYIGISKKSKVRHLIPQINQVIREMKKDGSLDAIIQKHTK